MSVLDEIVDSTWISMDERKRNVPLEQLQGSLHERSDDRPFSEALVGEGLSLIAEFKRRSPSSGDLRPGADVAEVVQAYERGGASAISVLTEENFFGGSLEDLKAALEATDLPILRKDFIVDSYMLYESAVVGADAVLLIATILGKDRLGQLYEEALSLDLDVLVEVHNEEELQLALDIDVDVIGINNRNLSNFSVDIETTLKLISDVPAGKTAVSESGISEREQLDELERIGIDAVLIGGALMTVEDPEEACRQFVSKEESTQA